MAELLARLAERHRLALLYLRAEGEPAADERLAGRCELVEEFPRPVWRPARRRLRRLRKGIRALASVAAARPQWARFCAAPPLARRLAELAPAFRPDVVQLEYHVMGQYLPALAGCPARRVLNQYEPGAAAAGDRLRAARGAERLEARLDLAAWERFERGVSREVDAIVVFTERDRRAMREGLPGLAERLPIVAIPPGAELPERPFDPAGEDGRVLFVGSFHHLPNVDAAVRLATEIFPRLRRLRPEAALDLVGDAPPERLQALAGPGIAVTGRVPSVEPYLDRAAVVVAPLRLGGGMRVKVLEALAAGKALVASPLAVEGLELVDGRDYLRASSNADTAEAIAALLAGRERRVELARCARAWAAAHLGWEEAVDAYEALYERLLDGRPAEGAR